MKTLVFELMVSENTPEEDREICALLRAEILRRSHRHKVVTNLSHHKDVLFDSSLGIETYFYTAEFE